MKPTNTIKMPPVAAIPHIHIADLAKQYKPRTIVDMGGNGRLKTFINANVTNANVSGTPRINALNMPFKDNSFDISTSINTLEHVGKHLVFLKEAYRVAAVATIHYFLCGEFAHKVEQYNKQCGHKHKHDMPQHKKVQEFIQWANFADYEFYQLISCREHLLLLAGMFPYMRRASTYRLAEKLRGKPYGYILLGIK